MFLFVSLMSTVWGGGLGDYEMTHHVGYCKIQEPSCISSHSIIFNCFPPKNLASTQKFNVVSLLLLLTLLMLYLEYFSCCPKPLA